MPGGYDYSSPGESFITICTYQRHCLFGNISDGTMHLNDFGQIVANEWIKTKQIRPDFALDEWIVMPNHIHGIVFIQSPDTSDDPVGAHSCAPLPRISPRTVGMAYRRPRSLSSFVAGFKSATTTRMNQWRDAPGTPVWQRNYYDHIIRNEVSLQHIRHYIQTNPSSWDADQLHPDNPSKW
ncbi:MAG: transposase [Cyanobacteria bacterium P01_E01_bin.6]